MYLGMCKGGGSCQAHSTKRNMVGEWSPCPSSKPLFICLRKTLASVVASGWCCNPSGRTDILYLHLRKQWIPQEMGISPGMSCWGKDRVPGGACFLERDFTQFYNLLVSWQDKTEAQTTMGQEWAEPHLDWNCLNVQILGPLFKLWFYLRTLKMDLGVLLNLFIPFPMWTHWVSLCLFSTYFGSIGLLRISG